ncbi:MAG: DUF2169 domain-containing protein, partial [Planctomycetota bacterium]
TCYVPKGENKTVFECAFKVGEWQKVLAVIGNRTWIKKLLGSKTSEPESFTKVDLTWAHAFGGEKISANPCGTGFKKGMLPNIEYSNQLMKGAGDKPAPACFGPINRQWKSRAGKMGSYDKKWVKERWPAQAADFDWSYYNSASTDQQIEGFLRGDEEIELVHINSEQARINFKLPGRAPRVFFKNIDDETVVESSMNLDTLFVDAENMLVHAVWRGVNDIADDEWAQCDAIVVAEDSAIQPAEARTFHPLFIEEVDEEEPEPEPDESQTIEEAQAEMEAEFKAADDILKKQMQDFLERAKQKFPQKFDPKMLAADPHVDFSKLPEALKASFARASAAGATIPPQAKNLADELAADIAQADALEAESAPASPPLTMIKSGEAAGGDFTGVDLSSQDLSGADLKAVNFTDANLSGTNLSGSDLTAAIFENTNLEGANLEQAKLNGASINNSNLKAANFTKADISDAVLANCDADGAGFTEAMCKDISISKLKAAGTDWSGADLSSAIINESDFSTANFTAANLDAASITDCNLVEAKFDKATLSSISVSGDCDATGISAREANAAESSWDNINLTGADFVKSELTSAQFVSCNLEGANLSAAVLPKSNLSGSKLNNSTLVGSNMFQAMLCNADLSGANLMAANLYEADLFQAITNDVNLSDTVIKGTLLAK